MEALTAAALKDYTQPYADPDSVDSAQEQSVGAVIKTFSAMTLRGVEILERYHGPDDSFHSLAILDLDAVVEAVEASDDVSAKVKDQLLRILEAR